MLEVKENPAFMRCVDVMVKLIEKYGVEEDETTYNEGIGEEVAS